MKHRFTTPQQTVPGHSSYDKQLSTRRYTNTQQPVDYRSKTFELMQTVTQMQIRQKQQQKTIFYYQRQLQIIHKQLQQFLSQFGVRSLSQVKEKCIGLSMQVQGLRRDGDRPLMKEEKLTDEYEKILREYKSILNVQEEKLVKYQQKWRQKQLSLTQQLQLSSKQQVALKQQLEHSQESFVKEKSQLIKEYSLKIQKLQNDLNKNQELINQLREHQGKFRSETTLMQQQNTQLKSDMQLLKGQFRQLIIERQSIQDKHQRLKKKYKQEIQHFQLIQKQVEEKLIEVEREITFYKDQRELNLQEIKKLKIQNQDLRLGETSEEQYSFGGYYNAQTQTEESCLQSQQTDASMTAECYEISIKSLLEENSRLKRTLTLLDKSKRGEDLPPEAELELKLLKGLTGSGQGKRFKQKEKQKEKEREREKQREKQKQKGVLQIQLHDHLEIDEMEMASPKFRHQFNGNIAELTSYQLKVKQVERDDIHDD